MWSCKEVEMTERLNNNKGHLPRVPKWPLKKPTRTAKGQEGPRHTQLTPLGGGNVGAECFAL